MIFKIELFKLKLLFSKYRPIKKKEAVKIVSGIAFIKNFLNPLIKFFLLSSLDNLNECLIECKKQK